MLKKLVFSFIVSITCLGYAYATPGDNFLPHDTVDKKKDSVVQPLTHLPDPKEGFRDLFIENSDDSHDAISSVQLNPLAISFVEDYIKKYGKLMEEMKVSAKPYFDVIDTVLTQNGLPRELKYLAVIESYLKTSARSRTGAVGVWQFMPATARNMGLKVGRSVDERKDLFKSTQAASKYLSSLYDLYENWLLVIAAYNSGPGYVNAAIRKSGSRDFWELQNYLPAQSRNHVKKFIATHYIMEGTGGIATLSTKEVDDLLASENDSAPEIETTDAIVRNISGRYNSNIIAKYLSMEIEDFNKLNPEFDTEIADNGEYELHLPADKMDIFLEKKNEILKESVQLLLVSSKFPN